MQPRQEIKVEARDAHDRIVGVGLIGNGELGDFVPQEGKVVVARVKGTEERRRGCKERHIL